MEKSEERVLLEKEINLGQITSENVFLRKLTEIINQEYREDPQAGVKDPSVIKRVQNSVRDHWEASYLEGYRKLEELEERDNYRAMHAYADKLDIISKNIPDQNKDFCHYPFSGVDFFWARIFKEIIFEDNSFDETEVQSSTWWNPETYSSESRDKIISLLRDQELIPASTKLDFLINDANVSGEKNQFNNGQATLLVKGGFNVAAYVGERFKNEQLKYGAIIIVDPFNPLKELEDIFAKQSYHKSFTMNGESFLAPYAMGLGTVHIFLKI